MLKTTKTNFAIHEAYDSLTVKYGVCTKHDNRPAYKRMKVDCVRRGVSVHTVVELVQCLTDSRIPYAIAKDIPFMTGLLSRVSEKPKVLTIEICDLNTFLLVSRQRMMASEGEWYAHKKARFALRSLGMPVHITLGEPSFSFELVEYIENLILNDKKIVPTLERMGYVAKEHAERVREDRKAVNLWK